MALVVAACTTRILTKWEARQTSCKISLHNIIKEATAPSTLA